MRVINVGPALNLKPLHINLQLSTESILINLYRINLLINNNWHYLAKIRRGQKLNVTSEKKGAARCIIIREKCIIA